MRRAPLSRASCSLDGAPFLRRQVQSLVPMGYRVQALQPDTVAIEALLKLKDSNCPAVDSLDLPRLLNWISTGFSTGCGQESWGVGGR